MPYLLAISLRGRICGGPGPGSVLLLPRCGCQPVLVNFRRCAQSLLLENSSLSSFVQGFKSPGRSRTGGVSDCTAQFPTKSSGSPPPHRLTASVDCSELNPHSLSHISPWSLVLLLRRFSLLPLHGIFLTPTVKLVLTELVVPSLCFHDGFAVCCSAWGSGRPVNAACCAPFALFGASQCTSGLCNGVSWSLVSLATA